MIKNEHVAIIIQKEDSYDFMITVYWQKDGIFPLNTPIKLYTADYAEALRQQRDELLYTLECIESAMKASHG